MNNNFFNNLSINLNNLENTQKNKVVKINFDNLDYINGDFCDNEDVNFFLKEKTARLYQIQANASLELGKIFYEAAERLCGDNRYNGLYEKWLSEIGFNKMTALRHRKRYELYIEVGFEHSKKIISILPVRVLSDLINSDKKNEILKFLDENVNTTISEIKTMVSAPILMVQELQKIETFKELNSIRKINIKKLGLDEAKQLKLELEKKIEEIISVLKEN
ncbi:MAG: hypothetical protein ACRCX2_09370 [Paraclostridium sp.]